MTRTVTAQHYSESNNNRLRLDDEAQFKSFWHDLQRALGGDSELCGYVSRAVAQIR